MSVMKLGGLASHLVHEGLLDKEIATHAEREAKQQNILLVYYLVKNNILSSEHILSTCAKNFGLTIFNLINYDMNWLNHLTESRELIRRYHVIPLQKENNILH